MEASSPSEDNRHRVLALASPAPRSAELPSQISESSVRLLGAAGAAGVAAIAVIHVLDAVGTYESTRWIFWSYIAVIALSATRLGLRGPWRKRRGLRLGSLSYARDRDVAGLR
ncbi:MAG TPA: hypothetical protein VMD48_04120 [Solirubrobacteraceae bacterium]|nr:hypothetical protein [Solirubrobacteraceae bacterium]